MGALRDCQVDARQTEDGTPLPPRASSIIEPQHSTDLHFKTVEEALSTLYFLAEDRFLDANSGLWSGVGQATPPYAFPIANLSPPLTKTGHSLCRTRKKHSKKTQI
ncbi:hypothetical protein V6N11_074971 [Hibiscus sabdariffa]|uniref:Uncharacterized protein n=1 Tax=Hibiscus sabdariffa TaxID=183260 RepID=A0ABR2R550_9ROSI